MMGAWWIRMKGGGAQCFAVRQRYAVPVLRSPAVICSAGASQFGSVMGV